MQFLSYFDLKPKGGVITSNRQLLEFLRELPEFEGYETQAMMVFLYNEVALHGAEPGSGRRRRR